jgi:hypothetical protein
MCRSYRLAFVSVLTTALVALVSVPARAQVLPSAPLTALDGKLTVGAEVVATVGEGDDVAFFNYTDYEHNALRMFRAALAASWRPASRVDVVGEIRTEDFGQVRPYAAYIRVRPWSKHAFDVQAGRIPPAFGAFGRRGYQISDNPLIGYPLAYQYLTSIRSDAIPATAADLLVMRARGWRTTYPIGSTEAAPGLPIVSAFRWDTGIQAHWEGHRMDFTGSVTTGTLSDPRVSDNNGGKQFSGRAAFRPIAGLVAGASLARGEFLSSAVKRLLDEPRHSYPQTAIGIDAEYSRDHWLVRGEMIWSRWRMPFITQPNGNELEATGSFVEGRYRFTPRIFVAARVDRLGFSRLQVGPTWAPTWDAPVTRVEIDGGYYIQRNLIARIAVQANDRDGGRVRQRTYVSGQLAFWF